MAVAALFALGAPLARGLFGAVASAAELRHGLVAERLVDLLRDRPPIRLLGKAYLWTHRRPGRDELVESILPRALRRPAVVHDKRELRRAVRASIEEDFATAQVVSVGGWLLADTEARLCGLAVIEGDTPAKQA